MINTYESTGLLPHLTGLPTTVWLNPAQRQLWIDGNAITLDCLVAGDLPDRDRIFAWIESNRRAISAFWKTGDVFELLSELSAALPAGPC